MRDLEERVKRAREGEKTAVQFEERMKRQEAKRRALAMGLEYVEDTGDTDGENGEDRGWKKTLSAGWFRFKRLLLRLDPMYSDIRSLCISAAIGFACFCNDATSSSALRMLASMLSTDIFAASI